MFKLKLNLLFVLVLLLYISFSYESQAQTEGVVAVGAIDSVNTVKFDEVYNKAEDITKESSEGPRWGWLSKYEFVLSLMVVLFNLSVLIITYVGMKNQSLKLSASQYLRLVSIVLIITSIMFLVTAGYDKEIMSPILGLLGTVAGYLLGKSDGDDKVEETIKNNIKQNEEKRQKQEEEDRKKKKEDRKKKKEEKKSKEEKKREDENLETHKKKERLELEDDKTKTKEQKE